MSKAKPKETDHSKFTQSLVHLPLISSIALFILTLLLVAMYFSEVFHIIMIIAMLIATVIMFYSWYKSR